MFTSYHTSLNVTYNVLQTPVLFYCRQFSATKHPVSNHLTLTSKWVLTALTSPVLCSGNSGNMTGIINNIQWLMKKGRKFT